MAYYSYKHVRDSIPDEFQEPWEVAFKENTGRDYECTAGYDGNLWLLASDYIDHLKLENERMKACLLRGRPKVETAVLDAALEWLQSLQDRGVEPSGKRQHEARELYLATEAMRIARQQISREDEVAT